MRVLGELHPGAKVHASKIYDRVLKRRAGWDTEDVFEVTMSLCRTAMEHLGGGWFRVPMRNESVKHCNL